jgi:osmotically-inducible protein OsmY
MTRLNLDKRVALLESQMAQLQNELRSTGVRKKDWRRTIGAFTDDEGMQEILREAMRLREADRRKSRSKGEIKRRRDR